MTTTRLQVILHKTGGRDNEIRNAHQAGKRTPELKKLLATKVKRFPMQLDPGSWHTLLVVMEGDEMRAVIDGETAGAFMSPGVAHPTMRMITRAVNKSAWVDDVKVWRLR